MTHMAVEQSDVYIEALSRLEAMVKDVQVENLDLRRDMGELERSIRLRKSEIDTLRRQVRGEEAR